MEIRTEYMQAKHEEEVKKLEKLWDARAKVEKDLRDAEMEELRRVNRDLDRLHYLMSYFLEHKVFYQHP